MPSLRQIPLEGAALREFYDLQVEKHDHGFVYPSNCQTRHYNDVAQNDTKPPIQEPISDNIVSSRNENSSSSASNKRAADCFAGNIDHIYAYPDKSTYVYNNTKRGEEGYLSDTILDEVLNCDYTHTFETHDHRVHVPSSLDNRKQQNQTAVNSRIGGTVVGIRKRFKSHHAYTYHQRGEDKQEGGHHTKIPPEHQHGMISSSASIISNAVNRYDEQNGQDISLHDSSFFWEDEARCTNNDITGSAALTEGTTKSCEPKRKKCSEILRNTWRNSKPLRQSTDTAT